MMLSTVSSKMPEIHSPSKPSHQSTTRIMQQVKSNLHEAFEQYDTKNLQNPSSKTAILENQLSMRHVAFQETAKMPKITKKKTSTQMSLKGRKKRASSINVAIEPDEEEEE